MNNGERLEKQWSEEDRTIVNPKEKAAKGDFNKCPMEYLVTTVLKGDALVHKHGADKYGKMNWRQSRIKASVYVGAMMRHLTAWIEGNDIDDEEGGSGLDHLYHLRACCAVVLDAQMHGTFVDDRQQVEVK